MTGSTGSDDDCNTLQHTALMMIAGAAGSDEDDDDQDIHQDTQRPTLRSRLKADVGDDSCDAMAASAPLKGDGAKAEGSLSGKARGKTGRRHDFEGHVATDVPTLVPSNLPPAPGKPNKAKKGRGKAPSVREASPPGIELVQGTTHSSTTHCSTTHCSTTHSSTTHCSTTHCSTTHCSTTHSSTIHCSTTHCSTTHSTHHTTHSTGHEEWLLQGAYVEVNWGSDWWQATAKRIKALGSFVCV